jgi:dipeptidyl-peptidase 4
MRLHKLCRSWGSTAVLVLFWMTLAVGASDAVRGDDSVQAVAENVSPASAAAVGKAEPSDTSEDSRPSEAKPESRPADESSEEASPAQADDRPKLQTEHEESEFRSFTSYENMVAHLRQVQATSPHMKLFTYGRSYQGRELLCAIFSRPTVTQPWEALISGKPIIVLSANVHGGERTYRESLLILLRELATPGTEANRRLDDLVILVIPSINPDGFVAGTRQNILKVDMNRDYMKLEQPEVAALVARIHHRWHPHLIVDGHNGGSPPYNVCYQAASNAASDPALTEICDRGIFSAIDQALEGAGYKSFYYQRGNRRRWTTGGYDARIGRNYIGMINSVGILLESPSGQSREDAVRSGVITFRTILDYAAENADELMTTVNRARRETVQMGESARGIVPVQMAYEAEDEPVTYEISEGKGDEKKWVTVTDGQLVKKPAVKGARRRPYAYLLPREAKLAIETLRRHNITVETLQDDVELEVDAYTLQGISYQKVYNHGAAVRVSLGPEVTRTEKFPAGTYLIPTGQMMGRVVTHLLEPETNDNIVYWNTMDAWLPKADLARFEKEMAELAKASAEGGEAESEDGEISEDTAQERQEKPEKKVGPLLPIYKLMRWSPMPTEILAE